MVRRSGRRLALAGLGLPLGVAAAAIGFGAVALRDRPRLPPAIDGERRTLSGRAGRLSYYVAGEGAPLLLLHSVNAAASAYEVKPVFAAMRSDRRVYALDLPGFGFSDRRDRRYDVDLFVDAVADMLDEIGREQPGVPVDALALSLSCEFLARAALERPDRIRTLGFVTPTGFEHRRSARRGDGPHAVPGLKAALSVPLWSQALFNWLTVRPSLRFFLEKTWGSRHIDEKLLEYDYLTTHQPGARHAPLAFVSGHLFSPRPREIYGRLRGPVLVLFGDHGGFAKLDGLGWARGRPGWRLQGFATGALPQFEHPAAFEDAYRRFLRAAV